ncbi:substrate-binding domain-containing protein [Rhodococcus sp. X156]|uniref:substrate-binding domain-containing protein n=1 Tax=Rhodococcus sp. X156 TaxID=2499145 RepID=UPI0013E30A5D|nr:substrate-binding domain-containing protein [Rhodococcus sp. X156]
MSRGPIIALGVIVVLVLGVLGWRSVGDRIDDQRASAEDACVSGETVLTVAADLAVTPALTELATRYTDSNQVVRDHCVRVQVHAAADDEVLAGLQGEWDATRSGPPPAAWVAKDSSWTAELAAAKPALLGKSRSVATSPVLLAVPQPAAQAMTTAGVSWADLPRLQGAQGWAGYGHPEWGTTTIALPTGNDSSTATALAVQGVVTAATGTAAVTTETLARPEAQEALRLLRAAGAEPGSTATALTAIRGLGSVAGSPYQAVPATEQQIYAAAQQPGSTALAGVILAGATPVADYPYVGVKAAWVDETQSRAAEAFGEYLGQPEQQQTLAAAGFRAGDATPPSSDAVSFAPLTTTLPAPDAATGTALRTLLATPAPASPPVAPAAAPAATTPAAATTVLLDISRTMAAREGDRTRLTAVTEALRGRIGQLPETSRLSLWTFSGNLDRGAPYRVDVPIGTLGAPDSELRRQLDGTLGALSPRTSTSLYFSVGDAYQAAVRAHVPEQATSLLVVTGGRDDGRATLRQLLAKIDAAKDPARPVRIDVVAVGDTPDLAALTEITARTGGTVVRSSAAELPGALAPLLG